MPQRCKQSPVTSSFLGDEELVCPSNATAALLGVNQPCIHTCTCKLSFRENRISNAFWNVMTFWKRESQLPRCYSIPHLKNVLKENLSILGCLCLCKNTSLKILMNILDILVYIVNYLKVSSGHLSWFGMAESWMEDLQYFLNVHCMIQLRNAQEFSHLKI